MSNNMKAAVLEAPLQMPVREVPKPSPSAHEVLLKVGAVGLCGTDIHIFRGEGNYNVDPSGRVIPLEEKPQILGHEFCGQVVELGSEVSGFSEGDRVVIDQGLNCHSFRRIPLCEYCETGDSHQCAFYREHGITGVQGAMAEFISVPAINAVKIPDQLPFLEAAIVEPLGCIIHSCEVMERTPSRYRFKGERPIQSVLICGSGPAGLLFTQYLRNVRGFEGQIIVADKQQRKLELAKSFGATIVDVGQVNLIEAVKQLTNGRRVELLIDACGSAQLFEQIPWLIRKQATILLYGHGHRGKDIGLLNLIQFMEPTLIAPTGASGGFDSRGRPTTYLKAVEAIHGGRVDVRSLITHAYPGLEFLQQTLTEDYRKPEFVKAVIHLIPA